MIIAHISEQPLEIPTILASLNSDKAGALNVFVGNVRNHTQGKPVVKLFYEAYKPMAIKEMTNVIQAAHEKWPIIGACIHHRVGTLYPSEAAVVIAVATAHRADSFEACRFMIDTLKQTVPIWKKEYFEDGSVWVAAHP